MIAANDLLSNSSGKYRCFDPKMRLSTILVLLSAISFSLVFSITSEIKKSKMESIGLIPNNISKFQKNNQRTINNKAFLLPRKILPNFAMETLIKLIYTEMDQLLRGVDKIDIIEECKKDMKLSLQTINDFVKNDREMSNWQKSYLQNALLPMIDASAKIPPSGILRGHVTVFGQYKECIREYEPVKYR
ncbi:Protein MosB [Dirofilaria immitis]